MGSVKGISEIDKLTQCSNGNYGRALDRAASGIVGHWAVDKRRGHRPLAIR